MSAADNARRLLEEARGSQLEGNYGSATLTASIAAGWAQLAIAEAVAAPLLPDPPTGGSLRRVLISEETLRTVASAGGRLDVDVEWGQPDAHGFYTPMIRQSNPRPPTGYL